MKRITAVVIIVSLACWITEGLTNWTWPIGATGTVICTFGLGFVGYMWWIRRQARQTSVQYQQDYIDRLVDKHEDGNVVG